MALRKKMVEQIVESHEKNKQKKDLFIKFKDINCHSKSCIWSKTTRQTKHCRYKFQQGNPNKGKVA
jgi:hypothetical protein